MDEEMRMIDGMMGGTSRRPSTILGSNSRSTKSYAFVRWTNHSMAFDFDRGKEQEKVRSLGNRQTMRRTRYNRKCQLFKGVAVQCPPHTTSHRYRGRWSNSAILHHETKSPGYPGLRAVPAKSGRETRPGDARRDMRSWTVKF